LTTVHFSMNKTCRNSHTLFIHDSFILDFGLVFLPAFFDLPFSVSAGVVLFCFVYVLWLIVYGQTGRAQAFVILFPRYLRLFICMSVDRETFSNILRGHLFFR